MERDERLLPLPNMGDLQPAIQDQEYPTRYPTSYDDGGGEKKSLQEYLHVIYKRLPIILAITILATAAAAFYMYRLPSQYSARTSLIIEAKKPKIQQISINLRNDRNYNNTQLKLLQNRDLMYQVVLKNGLYKNLDLFKNQNKGLVSTFKSIFSGKKQNPNEGDSLSVVANDLGSDESEEISLTAEEKQRAEMYAGMLSGKVQVAQDKGTNIVNITVNGYNPKLITVVANGLQLNSSHKIVNERLEKRKI